jgi:hypothetical protein
MRTDIDYIISLMKEFTPKTDGELDEQDTASSSGGGEGAGNNLNTRGRKWETGLTRSKANKLGLKGEKWESGLTRGHANPVA